MKKSILIIASILIGLLSNAAICKHGLINNEIWTKANSPYCIDGDILVAKLTIEPGVVVKFSGNYVFEVQGTLTAIGTPCDSIRFTSDTLASWKGILFQNSLPGTVMAWCIIENANTSGVRIIESLPKIYNCNIRNNRTSYSGGGLKVSNTASGLLEISYCTIEGNITSTSDGGGVWVNVNKGTVRFKSCIIKNNQCTRNPGYAYGGGAYVQGSVKFTLCTITDNFVQGYAGGVGGSDGGGIGGGIFILNGPVSFSNTNINGNRAEGIGGFFHNGYASGAGINGDGQISISNSIITNNDASGTNGGFGGGLYVGSGETTIRNSTFADNSPHAIYNDADTINLINSIIYFNNNNGQQVTGNIAITYSDVQGGYTGKGNINFSPLFQGGGVYKIVPNSPCINKGNPAQQYNDACFPPSLGNSRNDMGAHGGPQACTWNDCGYTALISTVKGTGACNNGEIKVNLFGTLNTIKIRLYNASDSLLRTFNAANCVVTHTFINLKAGNYKIKITNGSGCEKDYTAQVQCAGSSSLPLTLTDNNSSFTNKLIAYPNPTTGILTIKFNEPQNRDCEILVTDITGRVVKNIQTHAIKGENIYTVDLSNLANGTFLLQMKTATGSRIIKVVKE